jgi:dTMP kinase
LILVLAVSPLLAATIGEHQFNFYEITLNYNGASFTMLLAGFFAMLVGVISYNQMKVRGGGANFKELRADLLKGLNSFSSEDRGLFIVFEGGEGSGKSTQAAKLKAWLEGHGHTVVLTREPGGTGLGLELRELLLSKETGHISPRAEALLYAADRAHHVYSVIRPALKRGEIVISDRFTDSSIAYQGAGRILTPKEIEDISRWATEGLIPHLTIILDQAANLGLSRIKDPDRLESEPNDFHDRVRGEYAKLAAKAPERYLVLAADKTVDEIFQAIRERVTKASPTFFTENQSGH